MISKTKPYFNLDEIKAVFSFKKNPVKKFEEEFAKLIGCRYALSFAYGRTGIYALLKSQDIVNKEVVVPAYTCIVAPNAVVASGNVPKFVDISLKDYNMDLSKIRISSKTGAIIPTHMYGYPTDIKNIRKIVGNGVFIIEDAALALFTKDVGKYSDAAFFSFNIAKQMCTFDGCIVTTNRIDVYDRLKEFRDKFSKKNGIVKCIKKYGMFLFSYILFNRFVYGIIYKLYYSNKRYRKLISNWDLKKIEMPKNFLSRYMNIQARIGLAQLKKLKKMIDKRRILAKTYDKELENVKRIIRAPIIRCSSYSHYTIRVKNRKEFIKRLEKKGLCIGKGFDFDYVVPYTQAYTSSKVKEKFINSSIAAKEIVNLPFRSNLSKKEVKFICNSVRHVAR